MSIVRGIIACFMSFLVLTISVMPAMAADEYLFATTSARPAVMAVLAIAKVGLLCVILAYNAHLLRQFEGAALRLSLWICAAAAVSLSNLWVQPVSHFPGLYNIGSLGIWFGAMALIAAAEFLRYVWQQAQCEQRQADLMPSKHDVAFYVLTGAMFLACIITAVFWQNQAANLLMICWLVSIFGGASLLAFRAGHPDDTMQSKLGRYLLIGWLPAVTGSFLPISNGGGLLSFWDLVFQIFATATALCAFGYYAFFVRHRMRMQRSWQSQQEPHASVQQQVPDLLRQTGYYLYFELETSQVHLSIGLQKFYGIMRDKIDFQEFLALICSDRRHKVKMTLLAFGDAVDKELDCYENCQFIGKKGEWQLHLSKVSYGDNASSYHGICGHFAPVSVSEKSIDTDTSLGEREKYDLLTGLLSRYGFIEAAESYYRDSSHDILAQTVLLVVKVNNIAALNRDIGWQNTDKLLRRFAARIQNMSKQGISARIDQSRFLRVLPEGLSIIDRLDKITTALQKPFVIDNQSYSLSCDCHIFPLVEAEQTQPIPLTDLQFLVDISHATKADDNQREKTDSDELALDNSENTSKDKIDDDVTDLDRQLMAALLANKLQTAFRPIVNVKQCRIVGFHCEMQWKHPEWGMITPDMLSTTPQIKSIQHVGRYVLANAVAHLHKWQNVLAEQSDNIESIFACVKLSDYQLFYRNLPEDCRILLQKSNVEPHRLCLCITRQELAQYEDNGAAILQKLRAYGVTVLYSCNSLVREDLLYWSRVPFSGLSVTIPAVSSKPAHLIQMAVGLAQMTKKAGQFLLFDNVDDRVIAGKFANAGVSYLSGHVLSGYLDDKKVVALLQQQLQETQREEVAEMSI